MELSPELLSDIVGFCVIDPGDGVQHGRRKHARLPLGTRAAISSVKRGVEGIDISVVLRDMSTDGIGLLCSEQMEIGEEFVVQFSGEHGVPARILCIVRHCSPGGFGGSQFIVGASFAMIIFPVQQQVVASPGESEAEAEVEAHARITCFMPDESVKVSTAPSRVGAVLSKARSALIRSGRWCLDWFLDLREDATRTA